MKRRIRKKFRNDLTDVYNNKYDFYHVKPKGRKLEDFVKAHFREYIGKMYHSDENDFIWFAFDKTEKISLKDIESRFRGQATVEAAKLE
jgi:hypothetical protein